MNIPHKTLLKLNKLLNHAKGCDKIGSMHESYNALDKAKSLLIPFKICIEDVYMTYWVAYAKTDYMDKTYPKFKHLISVNSINGQLYKIAQEWKSLGGSEIREASDINRIALLGKKFQDEMGWLNNNVLEGMYSHG